MSYIKLHRRQLFKIGIPYWVFINGQPIGLTRGKDVTIQLPEGVYDIGVRIIFQLYKWRFYIGGHKQIAVQEEDNIQLNITDKERWWNILFDIDLVLWTAKFFYTLPYPWNTVYEIASNGFFIVWLVRIWMIRKHYYELKIQ